MNASMHDRRPSVPWYRHPWPWILMSIPLASIVVGIILLTAAFSNPHQVVIDNWYQEGRGINQSLALDENARQLGISASLHFNLARQPEIRLSGREEAGLQLLIYHATDNSRDRELLFLPYGEGRYVAADQTLSDVLESNSIWYLEVRDVNQEWRLRKRLQTPARTLEW
jgi:hypothetical protein